MAGRSDGELAGTGSRRSSMSTGAVSTSVPLGGVADGGDVNGDGDGTRGGGGAAGAGVAIGEGASALLDVGADSSELRKPRAMTDDGSTRLPHAVSPSAEGARRDSDGGAAGTPGKPRGANGMPGASPVDAVGLVGVGVTIDD